MPVGELSEVTDGEHAQPCPRAVYQYQHRQFPRRSSRTGGIKPGSDGVVGHCQPGLDLDAEHVMGHVFLAAGVREVALAAKDASHVAFIALGPLLVVTTTRACSAHGSHYGARTPSLPDPYFILSLAIGLAPFPTEGVPSSDMTTPDFDAETHTYTVDGVIIPGVTAIIGQALGLYDGVPSEILERASKRGIAVHAITEAADRLGTEIIVTSNSDDPFVSGCIGGWYQFLEDHRPHCLVIEHRVYHPTYGYCGTIDRVAVIGGEAGVLDIKTTSELHPETGVQLAAYLEAAKLEFPQLTKRWAVQLKPDGTYTFHEYTNERDLATFLACLQIQLWREEVTPLRRKLSGVSVGATAHAETLTWIQGAKNQ
jgi:hypothetical protein